MFDPEEESGVEILQEIRDLLVDLCEHVAALAAEMGEEEDDEDED